MSADSRVSMTYGRATVETIERANAPFPRDIVEEKAAGLDGLVWVRRLVYSAHERKDGSAAFDFKDYGGGSGYYPAGNWRNFQEAAE